MVNKIDPLFLYIKERITFMPWGLMPLILFYLGHGPGPYQYILIYFLLWGVFFFRVFDDYFCFPYDTVHNKKIYHSRDPSQLLILALIFGFLYFSSIILMFPVNIVGLNFIVLIFSNILYLVFRKNKLIGLISLMKYPLFVYMVAFLSGATNYIWVFIATFYFVVREVLEEFFNIRHKTIEGILLLALILFKISFRYLP